MRFKPTYLALCLIVIAACVAGAFFLLARSQPTIPTPIKNQLNFQVFLPKENQSLHIDQQSFKYDANLKVFSVVMTSFNIKNTISEQPTPSTFNDIPGYYGKLTQDLNTYDNFNTKLGKVYLTLPQELNGKQSAIMNTKGTLMFADPDQALTEDQWKQLFNALTTVH